MKIDIDPANQIGSFRSFCITKFTTNNIIHKNSSNLAKIEDIFSESQQRQSFVAPAIAKPSNELTYLK